MLHHTVVFSASSNALLGIEGASKFGMVRVGIDGAEEDGFILRRINKGVGGRDLRTYLVHSSVCEEESGILVWDGGRGGDEGVVSCAEIVKESIADAGGSPGPSVSLRRHGCAASVDDKPRQHLDGTCRRTLAVSHTA